MQEKIISEFSKSYFYDLFVYEDLQFKATEGELELTDLLIKVNEYIIFIQIKTREGSAVANNKNWFDCKVIKKANKQHKDTRKYIREINRHFRFKTRLVKN